MKDSRRVLLVEDDEGDVSLVQEAVRRGTVSVELRVARDGEEAMAQLRSRDEAGKAYRPELILLDLNMPRKDGRQVLAEVKGDAALKAIPIVVFTSSEAERDIRSSYDLCANCYVRKPMHFEQFVAVILELEKFWLETVVLPPAC